MNKTLPYNHHWGLIRGQPGYFRLVHEPGQHETATASWMNLVSYRWCLYWIRGRDHSPFRMASIYCQGRRDYFFPEIVLYCYEFDRHGTGVRRRAGHDPYFGIKIPNTLLSLLGGLTIDPSSQWYSPINAERFLRKSMKYTIRRFYIQHPGIHRPPSGKASS